MAITLRQLEIFIAVAETLQVTKASKKLFITQSAVSMALSELEYQLEGPLFDRHGRSLVLNDRGRYLLPLSKEVLSDIDKIENLMTEDQETIAGTLEIVASSTIGNYVLPYLIGAFLRMHPNAHINMRVFNTRYAESLIIKGEMDLGFVEGTVSSELIKVTPWFEDELVVIASSSDKLARRKVFRVPDDLRKSKWIMREKGSGTAQIFKSRLGEYASDLVVATELGHTEAIKKAVESGAGIGCLSSLTVCRETEQGWLKQLSVKGVDMRRQLLIIHHKNKTKTRLFDEFLGFCQVMSECEAGRACLSSPVKLQDMLLPDEVY
ncbi:MAG: LysR family transcriptional regulator [Desulfobulbaceae bacterium]|nr:LysR family transcriptional regulator [Desulfobulbaceae bacterium]